VRESTAEEAALDDSDGPDTWRPSGPLLRLRSRALTLRARIRARRGGHLAYRFGVALLGGVLVLGGLILVPLPGPGWLIVLLGLAVLGSEFHWAARLQRFTRRALAAWTAWLLRRSRATRFLIGALALLVLIPIGYIALQRFTFPSWLLR
jgi:uncharacterized protein (TIGR02611 family)